MCHIPSGNFALNVAFFYSIFEQDFETSIERVSLLSSTHALPCKVLARTVKIELRRLPTTADNRTVGGNNPSSTSKRVWFSCSPTVPSLTTATTTTAVVDTQQHGTRSTMNMSGSAADSFLRRHQVLSLCYWITLLFAILYAMATMDVMGQCYIDPCTSSSPAVTSGTSVVTCMVAFIFVAQVN